MSGFAALRLSLSLVTQPAADLFPGRWVPVQIGIVRYAEQPEGEWEKPKLEITLEWQPEDPDRLRWLSVEECREASERAARDFGPRMDTFILAGDQVYHPRTAPISFRYGGPAEVRMLFDLPEGLPDTLDLFVRQPSLLAAPESRPFSVSAPLIERGKGQWQTGPVTWTLDRVEEGTALPPVREGVAEELGPGYAEWNWVRPAPDAPEKVTRVTLIGAMAQRMSLAALHVLGATLEAGGQEWDALRTTRAQKQYVLEPGVDGRLWPEWVDDAAARPYLMVWFPVRRLPDGCRLTLTGEVAPDPADARLEYVFTGLPITWSAP